MTPDEHDLLLLLARMVLRLNVRAPGRKAGIEDSELRAAITRLEKIMKGSD